LEHKFKKEITKKPHIMWGILGVSPLAGLSTLSIGGISLFGTTDLFEVKHMHHV